MSEGETKDHRRRRARGRRVLSLEDEKMRAMRDAVDRLPQPSIRVFLRILKGGASR